LRIKKLRKVLWYINIVVVLFSLFAFLSVKFPPSKTFILPLFALAFPYLITANAFFLLFWLSFRKKRFWLSLICLIIGIPIINSFISFSSSNNSEKLQHSLISYNAHYLNFRAPIEDSDTGIISYFDQNKDVDFICIQELWPNQIDILIDSLDVTYHTFSKPRVSILSKHPIKASGQLKLDDKPIDIIWADVIKNKEVFRIYSVYLKTSNISKETNELAEEVEIQNLNTYKKIRSVLSKYLKTYSIRNKQSEVLIKHALQSPYPFIIAGDFNDTPITHTYRLLSNAFQDAFKWSGEGIGNTYNGPIPALRIDYIFAQKEMEIGNFKVVPLKYSDHFPIRCDFN